MRISDWSSDVCSSDLHRELSNYLTARSDRVTQLSEVVRHDAELPPSLHRFDDVLPVELRRKILTWRAANGVSDDDRNLLGSRTEQCLHDPGPARYARHLQRRPEGRRDGKEWVTTGRSRWATAP